MVYYRHGESGRKRTPEYAAWDAMIQRCENKNHPSYPNYGGRGIKVCDRWRDDYNSFLEDMGRRPSPEHSIERKGNDGHYCLDNCVWGTLNEQHSNTRANVWLTHDGRTMTVRQWATELGINYQTLGNRVRNGWTAEEALTTPIR
jgi:hypothetical protein